MVVVLAGGLVTIAVLLWAGVGNDRLRTLLDGDDGTVRRRAQPVGHDAGSGSAAGSARPPDRRRGRGGDRPVASATDRLAFDLDLAAICLRSGLPTEHALALAAKAGNSASGLDRLARAVQLGEHIDDGPLAQVAELIEFSGHTGVALAPLLRGLARDLRRAEHRRRQLAAARLGTQLVIPLGTCILPSFVLLGVIPVLITLVGDFTGIFGM